MSCHTAMENPDQEQPYKPLPQSAFLTKTQLALVMEGLCPLCKDEVETISKRVAYACRKCKTLFEIRDFRGGEESPS